MDKKALQAEIDRQKDEYFERGGTIKRVDSIGRVVGEYVPNNKPGGADAEPVKGDTAKDGGRECEKCKGRGVIYLWNRMYPQDTTKVCGDCGGAGWAK